jgi:non-specific serine/threonine protein kinase
MELAAARVPTLPPEKILERLDDRFTLLRRARAPEVRHHQTLHATIAWSYEFLSEDEKTLFRRLAIFPAAFTLAAVEDICGGGTLSRAVLLDLLSRLVDKSLVTAMLAADGRRFRFLDSIREFALGQLYESAEVEELADRYVAFYAALAAQSIDALGGAQQQSHLQMLFEELDNIRAALQFGQIHPRHATMSLEMACDLQDFWLMRNLFSEGRHRIQMALEMVRDITPALRARALSGMALLACLSDDPETALAIEEEALKIRRDLGDERGIAQSLHDLANYACEAGDFRKAHMLFDEAMERAQNVDDEALVAKALDNIGFTSVALGDFAGARAALDESLRLYEARHDAYGTAWVLGHIGWLAERMGEYQKGADFQRRSIKLRESIGDTHGIALSELSLAQCLDELGDRRGALESRKRSLRIWRDLGKTAWIVRALESFACAEAISGDGKRAATLLAAVEHLRTLRNRSIPVFENEYRVAAFAQLDHSVSPEDREAAKHRGLEMTLEDAVGFALATER